MDFKQYKMTITRPGLFVTDDNAGEAFALLLERGANVASVPEGGQTLFTLNLEPVRANDFVYFAGGNEFAVLSGTALEMASVEEEAGV